MFVVLAGCVFQQRGEPLEARLSRIAEASGGVPSGAPRLLRYAVDGHDGAWVDEIVSGRDVVASRRTRHDGQRYAFGLDARGAWLAVGDRPAVTVAGDWAIEARALRALHQLSFAQVEEISRDRKEWELAVLPDGGQRLTLFVDRQRMQASELDTLDAWARIHTCDALEWRRSLDGAVLTQARCGTGNLADHREPHRHHRALRRLLGVEPLAALPDWAAPVERRARGHARRPAIVAIEDERRILVPVKLGAAPATPLVLDTGAHHTILAPEVAEALGVVPTGEPPFHLSPPWLEDTSVWVGVVDTTRVGDVTVTGQRVLVADNPRTLQHEAGLLGCDFFRQVVLDVDTPARELRIWERDAFVPPPDAERIAVRGAVPIVRGEVADVARGALMLDTGMADEAVIHHPMMKWRHPRRRGEDVFLSASDRLVSPDYQTHVDGLSLGPFTFPRMPVVGRDRDTDAVGGGVGIVGMGVLRYLRLALDLRAQVIHATPGDGYRVLNRVGVDVTDGVFGPTVDRLVDRLPAERSGLQVGDVIVAVEGHPFTSAREVLQAMARHRGAFMRLAIRRRAWLRSLTIDLMAI